MPLSKVTIHVVDDDPVICRLVEVALKGLQWPVVCHYSSTEFLKIAVPKMRGCLVLDLQMPEVSGPELQELLVSRDIPLPVVFLSATADVPTTTRVMKRGAIDLIQKPFDPKVLEAAVKRAVEVDAAAAQKRRECQAARAAIAKLTPREQEVMRLVVTGMANKQIAYSLKLSDRTVEIHRSRVMQKTGSESLAQLIGLFSTANLNS